MEEFTNRHAILLWVVSPILLVTMVVGTFGFAGAEVYDEKPKAVIGLLVLLWVLVLWFGWVALTSAITWVHVERGTVAIIRRYPHKSVHRTLVKEQVNRAEIIEARDPNGGDAYTALVTLTDGDAFNILVSTSRDDCADACWRFNQRLFG